MILAIKGHLTRGKEVIEILEMLGGVNKYEISTAKADLSYTIRSIDKHIIAVYPTNTFVVFTLEEFLEKFPYKVGDKVLYKIYNVYSSIKTMTWNEEKEQVIYRLDSQNLWVATADELQPYKEETMEGDMNYCKTGKITAVIFQEQNYEDKVELDLGDYEIKVEDGKTYVVRKKPQYPKTYEECCKVLDIIPNNKLVFSNPNEESEYAYRNLALYNDFNILKVCRDAYWKIAGEEMGLGKSWEPDCRNAVYGIFRSSGIIKTQDCFYGNTRVLEFPTAEMRDAFYENFKELIEECKELL